VHKKGWIEKILCTVLQEAHEQQVEEVMDAVAGRPEGFYKSYLDQGQEALKARRAASASHAVQNSVPSSYSLRCSISHAASTGRDLSIHS
jgi:hypothetical protein